MQFLSRWTDLPLAPLGLGPRGHRFLLDFADPPPRHLHSPALAILRGSSQIDAVAAAIQRLGGEQAPLVFLEGIERVKFMGALERGAQAVIAIQPQADGRHCEVEMFAGEALIMSGCFAATQAFEEPHEPAPPGDAGPALSARDREGLRRLKASAPDNEHLRQITSLRQLDASSEVTVNCGEEIEAVIELDPALLTRVGEDAWVFSVGNLVQTCYQLPKVFMFSRSSLTHRGLDFYARQIGASRFRPLVLRGCAGHRIFVRLTMARIKSIGDNHYCGCTARVTGADGSDLALLNFSFLLDRAAQAA